MKARKLFIAAACCFVLVSAAFAKLRIVSDSEKGVEFSNRLGGFDVAQTFTPDRSLFTARSVAGVPQDFTVLSVRDYAFTNKVGYPMLPVRVELIEIPQGANLRVVYGKVSYKDIDLAKAGYPNPLYPVQPPLGKKPGTVPDFAYDAQAYRAGAFVVEGNDELVEVEVLGEMRATRIAKVVVKPFQYNAATHTLRIYTTLDFEIVYEHADWNATHAKKQRYATPAFGFLRKELANPIKAKAVAPAAAQRYLIVADPMFRDSLQKFAEWKTRFGYEVKQVYTDNPEMGNTAESIRQYLKNLYENATETDPAPSYVLFVGDLEQIPTKTYGKAMADGSGKHYSDLYLCEYTDDHFPEVNYGRMSASSVKELMPQINKTIYMESLSPERAAFLDTCVAVAGSDEGRYDLSHLNPTISYICRYYMQDSLQRHVYKYLYPESSTKARDIVHHINSGASVVVYTGHGEAGSWTKPRVTVSDVTDSMFNKDKYPFIIGNCCLTGKFDVETCYGEALLRKENAGAVAYIGATDLTYFDQDLYWAIGYTNRIASGVSQTYENTELGAFDVLNHTHGEPYEDWAMTAYEIVYAGNMAVQRANQDLEDYYWEVYHVFGDPSYMPYMHAADYPFVKCRKTLTIGAVAIEVNTVPYARVTLSKNGVIFGFAIANKNGLAQVDLKGIDSAFTLNLTVAAQNYLPYHGTVEVLAPTGKYVTVSKQQIIDKNGNAVQSGLYGETYRLRYTLRNVGNQDLERVDAVLVSQDEYIEIENASYTLSETLHQGEETALDHDFTIKVDRNVPDGHFVRFSLEMTINGDTDSLFSRDGKLKVQAPYVKVSKFEIDDSQGSRPDGIINNGETVKAVVTFVNPGEILAENVKMQVSSQASYLILPDEVFELGTMAGGESKTITFEYSAADADIHYEIYTLDFNFDINGRQCTDQVQSYIDAVIETFERGDFSFVDWSKESDWLIAQDRVHQGLYSACSAPIEDNGTSTLCIEVEVPINDKVGFYLFTSSEIVRSMGDFLNFYVDRTLMERWAGIDTAWRYAEFPIEAGTHTLTWSYTKDASEFKGEDKVWIDDIRLPIGTRVKAANESGLPLRQNIMQVVNVSAGMLELRFETSRPLTGNLYVLNALGQRVKTLSSGLRVDAGSGTLSFSVAGLPAGVYILVFENASGVLHTVKFVLTV